MCRLGDLIMGLLNVDDLPKSKTQINWSKSIGVTLKFEYRNIYGEVKIVDYNPKNSRIYFEYLNHIYDIGNVFRGFKIIRR